MEEENRVEIIEDEEPETQEDKGKEEDAVPEPTYLERLTDLIKNLKAIDGYEIDPRLVAFQGVINITNKKEGEMKENLEHSLMTSMEKFYNENREQLIQGKTEFLFHKNGEEGLEEHQKKYTIQFGESKTAKIPLGEIYTVMTSSSPEMIDDVDGTLFFIMEHVCPDEDFEVINDICNQFKPNEEPVNQPKGIMGFIGKIINTVSGKMKNMENANLDDGNGNLNSSALTDIVGNLITDGDIVSSMQDMMSGATNEKNFDVNETIQGLFNMSKK